MCVFAKAKTIKDHRLFARFRKGENNEGSPLVCASSRKNIRSLKILPFTAAISTRNCLPGYMCPEFHYILSQCLVLPLTDITHHKCEEICSFGKILAEGSLSCLSKTGGRKQKDRPFSLSQRVRLVFHPPSDAGFKILNVPLILAHPFSWCI